MYRIDIYTIGLEKAGPCASLTDAYLARLSPYADVRRVPLKAEPFRNEADRSRVLAAEADRVRKALPERSYKVLLTEHGKTLDSPAFAEWLGAAAERGARPVAFVIGGPLGVDPSLAGEMDLALSLSPLTFPHDLARVVLLEQLYRAITIQTGKTYHY
jgi:23S rRNA (pseudouridine1915-N3)-methyltransferase